MKTLKRLEIFETTSHLHELNTSEMKDLYGMGSIYYFDKNGHLLPPPGYVEGNINRISVSGVSGSGIEIGSNTTIEPFEADGCHDLGSGFHISNVSYGTFKYLADNTDVEWGISFNGSQQSEFSGHLRTNCNPSAVDFYGEHGYDTYLHNHPGDPENSEENRTLSAEDSNDIGIARDNNYKNPTSSFNYKDFGIYTSYDDGYINYYRFPSKRPTQ